MQRKNCRVKLEKELERKLNNFDFSCGANASDLDFIQ